MNDLNLHAASKSNIRDTVTIMGRGGFGGKGKYKKVILAVYPSEPTGEIQIHNVGKLVHFCELTPQKLPKVAIFLAKRVDTDLAKSRLGYVENALC